MTPNERRQPRKPATKLAHLQKKLQQQKQRQSQAHGQRRKPRGTQP